ncbi:SDR family NAD(P)-dependent oxidoreductase [Paenibacillus brasilensis]|uniref:NAD(P)-dependent dehydrogenase (Short-subunit alcohol dehydrogenase family) n=1 Tax=Paenibacillus brasilensis TaxID=128574 RepID=A0ABU0KSC4_9BACL|nr:SDR family NAD(P)-dependent oxidoreductase [Paenibacillus brasilensis]MDQ0492335.1 NAD(P)-dependent dehydrogenase (short-subunit alcohol dehydrogenase family) [Paenibacillus brasilensis]
MSESSLITTPFHSKSTASEVVSGVNLTGRRAVVTGATSGIGLESARALAEAGAEVTLAVRDINTGKLAAEDIAVTTGNPLVKVMPLNLIDRSSITSFVASWRGPLHILINNAGIMATPEMRTPEGWEFQFAINHLGHFALTTGLQDALAAADGARVVSVSSAGHLRSPVVFDDIHFLRRPYDPFLAYGQSKTANILFAVEASKRWANDGITANALMPGGVRTPGVARIQVTPEEIAKLNETRTGYPEIIWKTPEQGAATSVLLATSPLLNGIGGRYFENCNEVGPQDSGNQSGVAPYAIDPEAAVKLWELSTGMIHS